jgi:hypothetical protein
MWVVRVVWYFLRVVGRVVRVVPVFLSLQFVEELKMRSCPLSQSNSVTAATQSQSNSVTEQLSSQHSLQSQRYSVTAATQSQSNSVTALFSHRSIQSQLYSVTALISHSSIQSQSYSATAATQSQSYSVTALFSYRAIRSQLYAVTGFFSHRVIQSQGYSVTGLHPYYFGMAVRRERWKGLCHQTSTIEQHPSPSIQSWRLDVSMLFVYDDKLFLCSDVVFSC